MGEMGRGPRSHGSRAGASCVSYGFSMKLLRRSSCPAARRSPSWENAAQFTAPSTVAWVVGRPNTNVSGNWYQGPAAAARLAAETGAFAYLCGLLLLLMTPSE